MNFDQASAAAGQLPLDDPGRFFAGAIALLREGHAELLLPAAQVATERHPNDPRVWQALGLAARTSGESRTALDAFATAARLAPTDPLIAHSLARSALEAGKQSARLFERAFQFAPNDGTILTGRLAARVQEGEAERGAREMIELLRRNPLWIDGHLALAKLLGQLGHDPGRMLAEALLANPAAADLHRTLIQIRLEAGDLEAATAAAAAARSALGNEPWLLPLEAHIHSEAGRGEAADRLFTRIGTPADITTISLLARHLIRSSRPDEVVSLLEPWIGQDQQHHLWPYLSLAWRLTGSERWHWLEGDSRMVSVVDLTDRIGDMGALADHLRQLHFAVAPPLDQSVRGGTQTDGNLLLRDEPVLQALRSTILGAVADHVAQLPPHQPQHPTLIDRRTPRRIAGSWSVRLEGEGFHTDHVHSQGWISSAFYVALPEGIGSASGPDSTAGWLTLGESRELVPGLEPVRMVEPKVGRLVLFPSTMWHGTRPFPEGERMTVAFDIAYPKQS